MPKSRTERMVVRLRDLQAGRPDVDAWAVVSVVGLIMASSLPAGVEEDRVSAMSAAMLWLGERIAGELGRGTLDQVYIRGDNGYVYDSWRTVCNATGGAWAGRDIYLPSDPAYPAGKDGLILPPSVR